MSFHKYRVAFTSRELSKLTHIVEENYKIFSLIMSTWQNLFRNLLF